VIALVHVETRPYILNKIATAFLETALIRYNIHMKTFCKISTLTLFALLIMASQSHAGYLDECLTKILPAEDGSYIAALQCDYLDFFLYLDKDGKPYKRNYVPKPLCDRIHLVDFIPEERMFLLYSPGEGIPLYRGMVCDFKWNILFETGLEGMFGIIVAHGCWWGLTLNTEGKPIIREVSFDGFETIDHPLPEIKGVDYIKDLINFTVDMNDDIVMLFCSTDEKGFSGDGIIRKIRRGKMIAQWVVDIPYVPEMGIEIGWVGPVTDEKCNVIVGHYETPCSAQHDDRVRVHKFGPTGASIWTWGEKLYILSDIRISGDGSIIILRPGGPIYRLSPDCKYKGQILIEGITQLGEPECGKGK